MEIIEQRFLNFKSFLKTIPNISSIYLTIIDKCNLETFLVGLKQYQNKTIDDLINDICKKADIDLLTISSEQKEKFIRYITYFKEVSEI